MTGAVGTRQILSRFACFPEQWAVLANDAGIDVLIAGVGGGKTWIAALKLLFWALRHPRRRDGAPTEWLVLGRDYKLTREVQLEEILRHARNLALLGKPVEARVEGVLVHDARPCVFGEGAAYMAKAPAPNARPTGVVAGWVRDDVFLVSPVVPIPEAAIVKRATSGLNPEIELVNGVLFRGFSSTDVTRVRGFGFDGAWADEADYQTDKSFEIAMNRQRSAEQVRLVVTSSPAAAGLGWLWQLISGKDPTWDVLRVTNKLRVHRWKSDANPTNSPAQLAAIRSAMEATSPGRSKGELDGRFLGTEEAPGTHALDFARAFVGSLKLEHEETRAAVVGVDLGMTTDFTWLTVVSRTGVVLAMERFNVSTPGVPRDQFYPHVEWRIRRLIDEWNVPLVKMDTAMSGQSASQYLARSLGSRAKVEGYRTDSPRKKADAIEALGVALARQAVRIPSAWTGPDGREHVVAHAEQLRRELGELVVDYHQGYRTFDHPPGGHDDGVVSLALAAQGLSVRRSSGGDLGELTRIYARLRATMRPDYGTSWPW